MLKKIILSVISLIALIIIFLSAGNWLVIENEIKKSDVIIVISGGHGERVRHAVNLYHKNYADTLLISGCPGNENYNEAIPMRDLAVSLGVPPGNIILDVLEDHGLGTGEQAVTIREVLKKHHFESGILVTSNFHTRRASFIFKRAFKNLNIKLSVAYPDKDSFDPNKWWKTRRNFTRVMSEFVKLVWYWISYSGN
ncbi:YdcF family protein [candidate division KSB1 bacterium]|nr:YdcF family protein [candidate division KSB1 bacterium]